jgi:hypothetical protein
MLPLARQGRATSSKGWGYVIAVHFCSWWLRARSRRRLDAIGGASLVHVLGRADRGLR